MMRFSIKNKSSLSQRIKSPAVQGMAAKKSSHGAGGATDQAVLFYRSSSIFRARWNEPAGRRQPRRDDRLINLEDLQAELSASNCDSHHRCAPRRVNNSDVSSLN